MAPADPDSTVPGAPRLHARTADTVDDPAVLDLDALEERARGVLPAAVVAVLVVDLRVYRTRMVTRRIFWATYAIVVVFQLLMNGVLTGLDVVVYDPDAIWGPRIAYAPVEDLLFGFAMVTLTLASWAAVNRRANTARRRGRDTDTRRSSTR